MMTAKEVRGNWKQIRQDARKRWEKLTDQDLDRFETSLEDMVNIIQKRYKYSRRRAEKEVRRFARQYMVTMDTFREGLEDRVGDAQYAAEQSVRRARRTVARRPLQAVLAAMTLGLAMGLLVIPIRSLRE
jgi:ElaB/YqjD/DUF883 family membrane-anchored ribosome-binding protein